MYRFAFVGLTCLALGFGLGAAKWRGTAERFHREARMAVILDQAKQMPAGGVVVIGDSISERMRFDRLCGLPALNAGISWARSSDWRGDAERVIAAARPSIVVLSLGANDTSPTDQAPLARLASFSVRSNGFPQDATVDGTHLNAKGRAEWLAAVEQGCARRRRSPPAR